MKYFSHLLNMKLDWKKYMPNLSLGSTKGKFQSPYSLEVCIERLQKYSKQRYAVDSIFRFTSIHNAELRDLYCSQDEFWNVTFVSHYQFRFIQSILVAHLNVSGGKTNVEYECSLTPGLSYNVYIGFFLSATLLLFAIFHSLVFMIPFIILAVPTYGYGRQLNNIGNGLVDSFLITVGE